MLDAAGDLHVLAVGGDVHGRVVDRLQTRPAQPVDRLAADLRRQAGDEGRHAGDVEALFVLLLDAAPVDVFNQRRPDAGPLQQGAQQVRREVVGAHVAEDALLRVSAADRRSDGLDDDGATHDGFPFRGNENPFGSDLSVL